MKISLVLVFVVLTAVFIVSDVEPSVLLMGAILTFGVLFFANTAYLYFLLCLPLFILLRLRPVRWLLLIAALALPVAVGVLLPLWAERAAPQFAEQARAGDTPLTPVPTPPLVEFVTIDTGTSTLRAPTRCSVLCQHLLMSEGIDRVRLTHQRPTGERASVDTLIGGMGSCVGSFRLDEYPVLDEVTKLAAQGRCIVSREADTDAPGAIISLSKESPAGSKSLQDDLGHFVAVLIKLKRLTIEYADASALIQTQVEYGVPTAPLWLGYASCSGMCLGRPVIARSERRVNAFDEVDMIREALSTRAVDLPELDLTALANAVLDAPGTSFNEEQHAVIVAWSSPPQQPRRTPMTAENEATALRVLTDRREFSAFALRAVISRHPEFLDNHMVEFIEQFEKRGPASRFTSDLSYQLLDANIGVLEANRDRLLQVARRGGWQKFSQLPALPARLGADTSAEIAAHLNERDFVEVAALAACLASDEVSRKLSDDLLAALAGRPVNQMDAKTALRMVLTLARNGRFAEAKEAYYQQFPQLKLRGLSKSISAGTADRGACYTL